MHAHRLLDDVAFRDEHVPSISTINRIIRLTCTVDQHGDDTSHQSLAINHYQWVSVNWSACLIHSQSLSLVNFVDLSRFSVNVANLLFFLLILPRDAILMKCISVVSAGGSEVIAASSVDRQFHDFCCPDCHLRSEKSAEWLCWPQLVIWTTPRVENFKWIARRAVPLRQWSFWFVLLVFRL